MTARLQAGLFVLASLLLCSVAAAAPPYALVDLGTLGGDWSRPHGVNGLGQIVGESVNAAGMTHAFLYSGGVMTDLGTLGGDMSIAYGINDSGTIVGGAHTAAGRFHAFKWTAGTMNDMGAPSSGVYSRATVINNTGTIGGEIDDFVASNPYRTSPSPYQFTSFRCTATALSLIPPLSSGYQQSVWGINSGGVMVGEAMTGTNTRRAMKIAAGASTATILNPVTNGSISGNVCGANAINTAGVAVGWSNNANTATSYYHACKWSSTGTATDLGVLSGGNFSEARGIDTAGNIVGRSEVGDQVFHGFIYTTSMVDLNTYINPALGWTITDAWAINDHGDIICSAQKSDGKEHAVVIYPAMPGDATLDGKVSFADYLILANNFGQNGTWILGDFNGDGKVTFADYINLANNYGQIYP